MARDRTIDYLFGGIFSKMYKFEDKPRALSNIVAYYLDRTNSMFKYEGLPDTIPADILELMLQVNGHVAFYKHNDNLYVFTGGLGGEPNVYYLPTIYTISNPALKLTVNAVIDGNCVVMRNDTMCRGLMSMFERYSTQMVENELSLKIATINARITSFVSASDDRTAESARQYLKDIAEGKLGVIADSKFLEGIKSQPNGNSGHQVLTDLIEYEQYIKASLFNELGLNANYNMKRESINAGECQLNDDMLLPFIDDMLKCRQNALEKVNTMFGTNITVDYASSWKNNQIELETTQELMEDESEDKDKDNEKDIE